MIFKRLRKLEDKSERTEGRLEALYKDLAKRDVIRWYYSYGGMGEHDHSISLHELRETQELILEHLGVFVKTECEKSYKILTPVKEEER